MTATSTPHRVSGDTRAFEIWELGQRQEMVGRAYTEQEAIADCRLGSVGRTLFIFDAVGRVVEIMRDGRLADCRGDTSAPDSELR